jgi:hypothetical protein
MSIADEWVCEPSVHSLKGLRPSHLNRSSTDAKYRSRLCAHWANSGGTICPMRKKGKCDFAHGPLELRVKESRKDAWIQKAQQLQNNCSKLSNEDPALVMFQSAGEDVLSAARNIEKVRVNAAISASALVNGPENATGNLNMSAFHAAAFAGAISSGSRTPIPVHSSGSGGINGNGNSHLVASTLSPPTSTTLRANGVTFVPKHFSGGVKK